ncbi:hypothetical protein IMSAG049_00275 [Clostridiales bacterium]|nr:hypothetical protein IMSAG049_00275 [Clostridiales bacterium]
MNSERKKELLEEYKNRKPEKGIIAYKCTATDETFLMASNDTRVSFNSTSAKLSMNSHPNKRLSELWNKYGKEGFELFVVKQLDYKDIADDYRPKLEKMLEDCLNSIEGATKIWK